MTMHPADNMVVLSGPGGLELQPPRPANLPPINKAKKIAWVESQIKKDQHEAVNPNYRTPFRSKEDACKRLLRYHVFDEPSLTLEEWNQSEENFEKKSASLLGKYHSMMSKYHILLLQESTRLCSSSEEVMLARHWESDERDTLRKEKEDYARISNRIAELQAKTRLDMNEVDELDALLEQADPTFPPIPSSWETRYEQIVGKPYEPLAARKASIKTKVFSRKTEKADKGEQVNKVETLKPLSPVPDVEIKREPDISEMPVLEDERLFRYSDLKTSARSRNSSQASLDSFQSFRSRNDSGASRKELRVSLTNILNSPQLKDSPQLKKELLDTGSIVSSSSRPHSACSSPDAAGGGAFVGLKFNRTTSGRWSASLKRDLEDGESADDVSSPPPGWKKSRLSPTFGSDSDEDFSLADVSGEAAVRSILEQDDEALEAETARDIRFYSNPNLFGGGNPRGTPTSETGDNDSVQNAINSILDMHDRGGMQTPDDLNNLTGLLDSIVEDDDPNLDAAVKSIQGLL